MDHFIERRTDSQQLRGAIASSRALNRCTDIRSLNPTWQVLSGAIPRCHEPSCSSSVYSGDQTVESFAKWLEADEYSPGGSGLITADLFLSGKAYCRAHAQHLMGTETDLPSCRSTTRCAAPMFLQYSSAEEKSACQEVILPVFSDSEWPLNGGVTTHEQTCWDLVFCSITHSAAFAWHWSLRRGNSSPAASKGETHPPSRPDEDDQDDNASSAEAEIDNPGQRE
ncbi:hypothetical protein JCM24511_06275 [Saitozyma sp. JCM 24511]|nr:hypothetical protein JCM24511_06275 [Saitozyma sp. JCM 24511]